MVRTTLFLLFGLAICSPSLGDELPKQELILRVYKVGNLVAESALSRPVGRTLEAKEETRAALEELSDTITTICSPNVIKPYAPTLSLIVRDTKEGHAEIEHLLQQLGESDKPTMQVEYRAIGVDGINFTEEQAKEWHNVFAMSQVLSAEKTEELRKLVDGQQSEGYEGALSLRPGQQVDWGIQGRPCKIVGCVDKQQGIAKVRIDFQTGDDFADPPVYGSQEFELARGQAGVFVRYFDGGSVVWLISAKVIDDMPKETKRVALGNAKDKEATAGSKTR